MNISSTVETADHIVKVNRLVKPQYPDFVKEIRDLEYGYSGPDEINIDTDLRWCLHKDQTEMRGPTGTVMYRWLRTNNILSTCLNLRQGYAIQTVGVPLFRKLFKNKALPLWKSVVISCGGNYVVPYLHIEDNQIVVDWYRLQDEFNRNFLTYSFASAEQIKQMSYSAMETVTRVVTVNYNRSWLDMLNATKRKKYGDDTWPIVRGNGVEKNVTVEFFQPDENFCAENLNLAFELMKRGLTPDPHAIAAVNETDLTFASRYYNYTLWVDGSENWNSILFAYHIDRDGMVGTYNNYMVNQDNSVWDSSWYCGGVREFGIPAEITVGGIGYYISTFLKGGEKMVDDHELECRSKRIGAHLGQAEIDHLLENQIDIPKVLRKKVVFLFTDNNELYSTMCVKWRQGEWVQDEIQTYYGCKGGRLLRPKIPKM